MHTCGSILLPIACSSALALPLARSHRRQQRKKKNPSFLPTLLFRAICRLRTVYKFIYDKIYDYVYMKSRKYEVVHTLFVFSFCLKESEKKKILFSKNTAFFLWLNLVISLKRNFRMARNMFFKKKLNKIRKIFWVFLVATFLFRFLSCSQKCEGILKSFLRLSYPVYSQIWLNFTNHKYVHCYILCKYFVIYVYTYECMWVCI